MTEAQDEFDRLVANNTHRETLHPEDRDDVDSQHGSDLSEEEQYRDARIQEAMRMTTAATELKLPPASFDNGRSTGVKGVIADARSYESARKTNWRSRAMSVRKSVFGSPRSSGNKSESESEEAIFSGGDDDEEEFLSMWREARRQELEKEAGQAVRNRRTSPSTRIYGLMDEVDALGYLDAIEKVNRDTTVVVFVYDHEPQHLTFLPVQSEVSSAIESVLLPLVKSNPSVHFVKVHYEEIELDNAAVPAILAYRNQGDLFANLTGIIEMMPDDEHFCAESLQKVFKKHGVL
ncbi:thioredoxin-like protein [Trichoderma cornu-damae]|uniref:Thioredoxin-like protein n=1 Tax=Trichoderma cornu-damae TaxID=654480 RepID=A0A9P8QE05_9HYPO|nr:thioredoxin-like protein [Trichoderma cornu-damae]